MRTSFGGRYKLFVHHGITGQLLHETPWFDNLITNNGLDRLRYGGNMTLFVGSGNTPPTYEDTEVESLLAETRVSNGSSQRQFDALPYYGGRRHSATFGVGAVVGTVREVAVGNSSTNLFSRALLVDEAGAPTELTLDELHQLTAVYELRQYLPADDWTGTIQINGDDYACVARPCRLEGSQWWITSLEQGIWTSSSTLDPRQYFYSDATLGEVTGGPSGARHSGPYGLTHLDDHVPGSPQLTGYVYFGPSHDYTNVNVFELGQGFSNVWGLHDANGGRWQFSIDPPISFTRYERLRIDFELTWGRYEP